MIEFHQKQERYELEDQHRAVAEECAKWELREQKILLLKVLASKPVTASSTICSCTKDVDTPIPTTPLVALRPSATPFVASTAAPPPAHLPSTQPSLPTPIPVPNLMLLQQQPMTTSSPLMPCTPSQLPPLSKLTGEGSSKDSNEAGESFQEWLEQFELVAEAC